MALKKGKLSEEELLSQKIELLKRLVNKGFQREKIEALMGFLKLYVGFSKSENGIKFDQAIQNTLNKPKETMGIVEFVLERERRLGEKKGIEKGIELERNERSYAFVKTLLTQTNFDDAKIAELTSVTLEFVKKVRLQNQ